MDGSGHEVRLQHPLGVAATDNTVYVADSYNHKVNAIALHENRATTLAGGDGQQAHPDCDDQEPGDGVFELSVAAGPGQ